MLFNSYQFLFLPLVLFSALRLKGQDLLRFLTLEDLEKFIF